MRRIETLEEGQSHGHIRAIYEDIQRVFGTPFVGSLFRALATQPGLLETVWLKLKPNMEAQAFVDISNSIRQRADSLAQLIFELENIYSWLHDHRFEREDIRRIFYTLEVLHYTNPKLLLATAAITVPITGISSPKVTRRQASQITSDEPEFPNKIPQVMFEQASNGVKEDYYDIVYIMGVPFVPDDFQALANWPPFLHKVWNILKPVMRSRTLLDEALSISEFAIESALELPHPIEVEEPGENARRIVETFLSLYSRTMMGISAIRWMMIEGQRTAKIIGRAAGERLAD